MYRLAIFISVVYLSSATSLYQKRIKVSQKVDPDAYRNVSELITSKGYGFEEHSVETEDGYILGLHRILTRRVPPAASPVVLLQHGLLSCSAAWVENLANQSLGFILSDANIDVWMGNNRGNTYSKRHKKYTPKDEQFWQFSWDEMAKYDLPATVNYILKTTNATQIYFVGHSQGAEIVFAGLENNQDLSSKIKHFFALGPVTSLGNISGPFKAVAPLAKDIEILFNILGKGELLPTSELIKLFGRDICGNPKSGPLCENLLFFLAGHDSKEMNQSRIPVYVAEHPAGTSVQNLIHYAQAVLNGKFQMFDYGSKKANMEHYNQTTPPLYDASLMKNSISFYTGGNDILADPTDATALLKQLPNVYRHIHIPYWEHLDFIWAMDAATKCYSDIVSTIRQLENQSKNR